MRRSPQNSEPRIITEADKLYTPTLSKAGRHMRAKPHNSWRILEWDQSTKSSASALKADITLHFAIPQVRRHHNRPDRAKCV